MAQEVSAAFGPSFQMWVTFAIIVGALVLYALERYPMEITSIGVICALLVFFHFFPVAEPIGGGRVDAVRLLQGFANPALITVVALLVMGQGLVRTGILDQGARLLMEIGGSHSWLTIAVILAVVLVVSAYLNNIPVVVIFIPVMQAVAARYGRSVSKVMIPLSFAAVFGGMTTLVGSSTNLLVNGALVDLNETPFAFFDFTIPGLVLAGAGLLYVLVVAPRLLPDRAAMVESLIDRAARSYIAQITVSEDSHLVGQDAPGGRFEGLPDIAVHIVQRNEQAFLPPFARVALAPGDVLVAAATRQALANAQAQDPGLLYPDLRDGHLPDDDGHRPWHEGDRVLAEVMVAPGSSMIGRTLKQVGFRYHTHCIVLAIQRHSHMIREPLTDIRLKAGDELLVQGQREDIHGLKESLEVVLIEWSAEDIPALDHAKRASLIFVGAVALAAAGIVPIVVVTLCAAVAMVVTGVLTLRQALNAIDPLIIATIASALALGVALQGTGGAAMLAHGLVAALDGASTTTVLSLFFLLVAGLSNLISTKTTAVLFTPIAIDIAHQLGAAPEAFAVAVVFAANCSFASPIGYQTNLLVMGPGHYRFVDFSRVGAPLIIVVWLAFTLFAPWYYGI